MRAYIIRRVLLLIPTLLGITMVVFLTIQSIPGDPIEAYLGEFYEEDIAAALRAHYGLDRPIYVQYVLWLGRLVRGDWGNEVLSGLSVLDQILEHLPVSLELMIGAMIVALFIAIPAGIISSVRPYTASDYTAMTGAMVGISMPEFFGGIVLVLIFSLGLGVLPVQGYKPWSAGAVEHLSRMALPILTRLVRSCMLEIIGQDYVKTARSKGIAEFVVIHKHALKNALIPVVTVLGLQVGFLVGGSIIVETIFSIPGLGQYGINSISGRDYPAVMGFILVSSSIFVLANLAVDLLYAYLDPRIRYEN